VVPKLTYLIPTIGRSTLARAVDSVRLQLAPTDQLFVISDGPDQDARFLMARRHGPNLFYLEIPPAGDYGGSAIDYAMPLAAGDYLCYLGDDDVATPGAMAEIRGGVQGAPQLHIFAMRAPDGHIRCGSKECSFVSGQQLVVPNLPGLVPRYGGVGERNDFQFLLNLLRYWPEPVFHDEVIADMPQIGGGQFF
jgi:glycosyltransferase involved in cell wall biosynthesis